MKRLDEMSTDTIERFALQYGCTPEEAANVTANVYKGAENQELMVKTASNFLRNVKVDSHTDDLFSFQEDAALHSEIMKLDHETRISFILCTFHQFQTDEIAEVLACTSEEVKERVQQAKNTLKAASNGKLEVFNFKESLSL